MRNEWQDEAVKKTSWPQEDGPAAAGAAQHRNSIGRTSIEMGLIRQLAAGADDNREAWPRPEPQHGWSTRFGVQQQRFIERKVFGKHWQSEVESQHLRHRSDAATRELSMTKKTVAA